jgi:hypothetical protein
MVCSLAPKRTVAARADGIPRDSTTCVGCEGRSNAYRQSVTTAKRQHLGGYVLLGGVQDAEQSSCRAPHGCQGRQSIGEWPERLVTMVIAALHSAAVCRECISKCPPCLHLIGSNGQLGFEASDIGLRTRARPPSCGAEGCRRRTSSRNRARSHDQKLQPPFTMRNNATHDRTPSATTTAPSWRRRVTRQLRTGLVACSNAAQAAGGQPHAAKPSSGRWGSTGTPP